MTDPRCIPQSDHLKWVDGIGETTQMQVSQPVVNVMRHPDGARDRQVIFGETVDVFGTRNGWSYCQTVNTKYVGFIRTAALANVQETNLRVRTQWATIYNEPNFKTADRMTIPHGSHLTSIGEDGAYWETPHGFVPKQQVTDTLAIDPAAVALGYIGTPYLWGGNSASGIDCSGLIQAAYLATGRTCPGDSDLMERQLKGISPQSYGRNQLLFWKGHVAITISDTQIVHANAHAMAVSIEGIEDAIARISAAGDGPVTRHMQIPD